MNIEIPFEIFERLKKYVDGFGDTPANAIERLLNRVEGVLPNDNPKLPEPKFDEGKDYTRYIFNEHQYGKGRLVLAVVKEYVSSHPHTSFGELLKIFPKNLEGSIGVFNRHEDVQKEYEGKNKNRHFTKSNELIQLSDCVIAVCTEWKLSNVSNFIKQAESLGYTIDKASND
jgi:hypothetical protein